MAKHKEVPIKTLEKILNEVELGLNDKSRSSGSVTDPTLKTVLSTSLKAAAAAGIGGAAVAAAGAGAAALAAGGIGVAAGGGFAFAGGAALAFAGGGAVAGGGLLAGALAILGGPIGWAAAGAAIIAVIVGLVKKEEKKNKKAVLFQEAIAKQNRIIKEQAATIEKLKKKQNESEVQKQEMAKVIDELIARIDYLTSLLIATEAVKEACA